jgi:predicted NUDIX family phosphoesterase
MEQVYVVPRSALFGGEWPQGYVPLASADAAALLSDLRRLGRFEPRPEAEQTPSWKQVIPYCVIRRPGEVFCVQRKAAATEVRLHGKLSIGLGGHVNPESGPVDADFFRRALLAELTEELEWQDLPATKPRLLGLLNDDATEVGSVHVGLVFAVDWPTNRPELPPLQVREVSKLAGGFLPLVELQPLWQDPARFESWSRVLLMAGIAGATAGS